MITPREALDRAARLLDQPPPPRLPGQTEIGLTGVGQDDNHKQALQGELDLDFATSPD